MLYRNFGNTSKKVSILGFGCMRLPIIDGKPDNINEPVAMDMIRYAIDNGVNYIDTAYPYHGSSAHEGGMSEILVGKALKDGSEIKHTYPLNFQAGLYKKGKIWIIILINSLKGFKLIG